MTDVEKIEEFIMDLENKREEKYSGTDYVREAFDALPHAIRTHDPAMAVVRGKIVEVEKEREHLDIQIAALRKAITLITENAGDSR